ncbi:ABC transporter ATP-binding protein [Amycolatopsis endophytica]|uniref:Peptide/nickel transport system ATP-binding protein n=1 Tax=Amycolatopsis endophytica TaxID=860233 RepID=A0A853BFM9_9PSEU|nr:ATP-binding cassette domain-containing protein [Amycolatopsis endophytica]NYI93367.1 peptide/nickel transport system ATP-binding protein [Amycolatopsis endophytica]
MTLVEIRGLTLATADGPIVDGVDLTVAPGEAVGVVGPSGSGKTSTALAVLGHLRPGVRHTGGRVLVTGQDMLPRPAPGIRGVVTGYVGQDPGAALNPYARVGAFLRVMAGGAAEVDRLLARVGLDAGLAHRYPHQLSGGQQQRVVIAAALARSPRLLVLDEPTTALDLVAKQEVTGELARLRDEGIALLWISHDLATVEAGTDRVVAFAGGRVVPGTAGPVRPAAVRSTTGGIVLEGRSLTAAHGPRTVLSEVDFAVRGGECLAVLGTSGAGKSTLARRIAGLHPGGGTVLLDGEALPDVVHRRGRAQRAALGLVAQSPVEALHPRQTVRTALDRPLRTLRGMRDREARASEITRLLEAVHLPAGFAGRLPGELSGGQRQRVSIARALAAGPRVLVCDEPTSALDAATGAEILALLGELRARHGLAVVLITHDATVAVSAADRLLVLADGRVTADGPVRELVPGHEDPDQAVIRLLGGSRPLSPTHP